MTEDKCECEEMIMPAVSPYGPASPIISVKNHLYYYDDVDDTTTRALFSALHSMAMEIIAASVENNTEIVPIYLHINSYGGDVSMALATVQVIKDIQEGTIHKIGGQPIKVPIYTVIEGEADSAASLIACVGTKRFISRYAFSLIHPVRQIGGIGGKAEEIKVQSDNIEMFSQRFKDIYLAHSKLTAEKLEDIMSKEDYSTPEQLLEWGLVDQII